MWVWKGGGQREWYKWNFLMRWIWIHCVMPAAATAYHDSLASKWENYTYIHLHLMWVYTGWKLFWKPLLQKAQRCATNHVFSCSRIFVSFHSCVVRLLNCLLACSFTRSSLAQPQKNTLINPQSSWECVCVCAFAHAHANIRTYKIRVYVFTSRMFVVVEFNTRRFSLR